MFERLRWKCWGLWGGKKKIEFILIILNVKKRDNDYYKVKNNGLFFNDFYILGNYNF